MREEKWGGERATSSILPNPPLRCDARAKTRKRREERESWRKRRKSAK